jgi:site-specific DNA-methyltransferase (cytosine-N4-specific)
MIVGDAEDALESPALNRLRGKIQLIFTSPPFPLNRKKAYGNLTGDTYLAWLADYAPRLSSLLTEDGSMVLEIGNSWDSGQPTMSTLGLRALLAFLDKGGLHLCQQFVCHNPARLPSPIQWVNIERSRVKDSFTHVWWMAKSPRPKANNKRVVIPYSDRMVALLARRTYNAGKRPSQHGIGERSFLTDNGGAIPSNVLTFSNTRSNDSYLRYCRMKNIEPHPARMPSELAEFFIRFLTESNDYVLDPFAGSNTTGSSAERLRRRWIAIEANREYVRGSRGRFISGILRNGRA